MTTEKQDVIQGPKGELLNQYGMPVTVPKGWAFLPAGDAGLTRKITALGNYWRVVFKKRNRTMSKGIWAPASIIQKAQKEIAVTRSTEEYKKQRAYAQERRSNRQAEYEQAFFLAVKQQLHFHEMYKRVEAAIAQAVTAHAILIGSGTVARTASIPIEKRAAKAITAWMRHNTTAYNNMKIVRIKGERRNVRRELAEQSKKVLNNYRKGKPVSADCPLYSALHRLLNKS